jgi:hypothetical protein
LDSPELLSEAEKFVLEMAAESSPPAAASPAIPELTSDLEAQLSSLQNQV